MRCRLRELEFALFPHLLNERCSHARMTLRNGNAFVAFRANGVFLRNPNTRQAAVTLQRQFVFLTSLIRPTTLPSESRTNDIHRSWSGIFAMTVGSCSSGTPAATSARDASCMSLTL